MFIDHRVVTAFEENSYLLGCPDTGEAALIDPGGEADVLWDMVEASGLTVKMILNTHAHIDHIGAVAELQELTGAAFYLHPEEEFWLEHLEQFAMVCGLPSPPKPELDQLLNDGQDLQVGNLSIQVLLTPGHSAGHVSFALPARGIVFTGDCLFAGSIGRTDLPGGNHGQLLASIHEKLLTLSDQTRIFPGHGKDSTVGAERAGNPFLVS